MRQLWPSLLFLSAAVTSAASDQCPSSKCTCISQEVASRQEVEVTCNNGRHQGYVPVYQKFDQPISSLTLNRVELTYIGNNTFRALSLVRELYLNDNYLSNIELQAFASIDSSLELLDLQHNRISDLSFLTTHNFHRLRELLLRDNRLTEIRPDSFAFLPLLENLNLDDNHLSGRLTFLQQPSLIALSYLNLDANSITDIYPEDFTYLRHLKSLLVNRNNLENLQFLEHPSFKQLQGLSASGNQISHVGSDLFTAKRRMKWIDLSFNKLTEANFTSSCSLKELEEIYLSHNQLTYLPETAFQATESLTIFVVNGNHLSTLPRCSLEKFYSHMDTFDISENPLVCDCELSWLKKPHTIMIEKQSQCSDTEFTDTGSFSSEGCQPLPLCDPLDDCADKSDNLMYIRVTHRPRSDLTPPTSSHPQHPSQQCILTLTLLSSLTLSFLYYYCAVS